MSAALERLAEAVGVSLQHRLQPIAARPLRRRHHAPVRHERQAVRHVKYQARAVYRRRRRVVRRSFCPVHCHRRQQHDNQSYHLHRCCRCHFSSWVFLERERGTEFRERVSQKKIERERGMGMLGLFGKGGFLVYIDGTEDEWVWKMEAGNKIKMETFS